MSKLSSPAIQWYFKQWLGDQKVLAMDWDANGMHFWLINLSLQEDPVGTIPNDTALIRRWLRNPSDDVWRRVQPQIFSAWTLQDGRWHQKGAVTAGERQLVNSQKRKAAADSRWSGKVDANALHKHMQKPCSSSSSSSSTSKQIPPKPPPEVGFDHDMVATAVMAETGAHGMETRIVIAGIALNEIARGRDGLDVKDHLIAQWERYRDVMPRLEWTYGSALKFFAGGLWASEESWPWQKGKRPARASPQIDPLEEQRRERREAMEEKQRLEQERAD